MPSWTGRLPRTWSSDLAARIGGKNVALMIIKRLPLAGGGLGAMMDGLATYQIGRYAKGSWQVRRALAYVAQDVLSCSGES